MIIKQIDAEFHNSDCFREQLACLYPAKLNSSSIVLLRNFVCVCQPGRASFDPDQSGEDSFVAWQILDKFIEDDGAIGLFHTHPPGISGFSFTDIRTQHALAKTYGNRLLWHGVQDLNANKSTFVCCWMEGGRVFRYEYPLLNDDLFDSDPLISPLSLPVVPKWIESGYYRL